MTPVSSRHGKLGNSNGAGLYRACFETQGPDVRRGSQGLNAPRPIDPFPAARDLAEALVRARLSATLLGHYPGPIPPDMASAYAVQDAAISLWPDEIAGWKVGLVPPARQAEFAAERLAGPIFRGNVFQAHGVNPLGAIPGGFAAVEAEFVVRIAHDTPADKLDWTEAEARAAIGALHLGVELAGSPLPMINDLGPAVTASDFGNNAGLILGAEIEGWESRSNEALTCAMFIDEVCIGRASAAALPGGPIAALTFLLQHAARRGRPLREGQLVSTGAATGVHEIEIGQTARAVFGDDGEIRCEMVAASPVSALGKQTEKAGAAR